MHQHIRTLSLFFKICAGLGALFSIGLLTSYYFLASPPTKFSSTIEVKVERGQGVLSIAKELEKKGVVRSGRITANLLVYAQAEKKIKAGVYLFKEPESAFTVAKRFLVGDFGYIPVKILIPEGTNYRQIASIIHSKYPDMSTSTLEAILKQDEGFLFPDTYFFPPMATQEEIISKLKDTFEKKISPYKPEIEASGRSLQEIITLASILEEEVQTTVDRQMVADLLLRRIKMGMPLQVDASLKYTTGKGSADLTLKDLRTDSPYNTYTRKGLPPTPISSPGLDSIVASLRPIKNDYLFYLSDKDGITHFAKTHAEHVKNKQVYLK